jgi:hypothetical protein
MQTVLHHLRNHNPDGPSLLNGISIAVIHEGDNRYVGASVMCCTDQMNRMKGRLASVGRANMIRDIALGNPVRGKRKWLKTKTAVATYTETVKVGFRVNVRDKKLADKTPTTPERWQYKEVAFNVPDWMLKPIPEKKPKTSVLPDAPTNI